MIYLTDLHGTLERSMTSNRNKDTSSGQCIVGPSTADCSNLEPDFFACKSNKRSIGYVTIGGSAEP
jgi:hypothetical protein